MKLTIDTDANTLTEESTGGSETFSLYSREAFERISRQWVKVGWDQGYSYTFSWMGRPVIQLPEDMLRIQEAIYHVKPDVIVETGVAHGGSLIFYACLCKAMERGRVIGVDIEIRPRNREAIESHELGSFITLVEGDSVAPKRSPGSRRKSAPAMPSWSSWTPAIRGTTSRRSWRRTTASSRPAPT